jgi:hypothetical protein
VLEYVEACVRACVRACLPFVLADFVASLICNRQSCQDCGRFASAYRASFVAQEEATL